MGSLAQTAAPATTSWSELPDSRMLQEVPCRDTDPDPGLSMDIKEEDRDSPVAFTINFGGGEEESAEEKNKRMERFALRSSQRKPRSPRLEPRGVQGGKPKVRGMVSEPLQKTFLREKSELKLREKEEEKVEGSRRLTTVISPGRELVDFTKTTNELTCNICVDVITDLDNFITDATTEDQIIAFFKGICHTLGSIMGSPALEAECNAMFETNLPQIIDDLVNNNLDPMTICTTIGACP